MTAELYPSDECPNCAHLLKVHDSDGGCVADWVWDFDGIATTEGCLCPLTLAGGRS